MMLSQTWNLVIAGAACAVCVACSGSDEAGGTGSAGETVPANQSGTLIETVEGPLQGQVIGKTRAFFGIPYAAQPVGDLRWKPPQPVEHWSSPLDATAFGPACPQGASGLAMGLNQPYETAEACLFINVWSPETPPDEPAPVMVWIHGGGFQNGTAHGVEYSTAGTAYYYDAQSLVERTGVVLVSMQYRVNVLGFLAHPALAAEDAEHPSSGNYGIEDQRSALQWVQRNVAAFSGDPKNVTIFGESAGGSSVCLQYVSPPSRGLFRQAISQSGGCTNLFHDTSDKAQAAGVDLAQTLGCTDPATVLSCLRSKTPEELGATAGYSQRWVPSVDGLNFPKPAGDLLDEGAVADAALIAGTNRDEGTLLTWFNPSTPQTAADYETRIRSQYADKAEQVLALYPSSAYPDGRSAWADVFTDTGFACPTRQMVRGAVRAGNPAYLYHFTYDEMELGVAVGMGAFHGSEIRFIFGTPLLGYEVTPEEQPLRDEMGGYWSRFARAGDPNGAGAAPWPGYMLPDENHVILDTGALTTGTQLKQQKCDFWDTLR